MKKLAIVTTHPIQYNAPLFKILADRQNVAPKVFYTWSQVQNSEKFDPDFGKVIAWDVPLLDGYSYEFVENISSHPGSHGYKGINNPGLIKAIEDWRADAVLVFGWSFKSNLACIRHFKRRIPVLFRGDSTLIDDTGGLKAVVRKIFLRWVYRHIDYALYTGENNKLYFQSMGLKTNQLVKAYHAIDNDRFSGYGDGAAEQLQTLKTELHIKPTDFVILFAGKLEEKKNPHFILKLAAAISDPDFKFLIVGNGRLEAQLKQEAAHDKRILFMDFQNQSVMPLIYRLGQVYILPSKGPGETWGLAANEAMACGLPIVLSNKTGGAVDLVKGNGLIFHVDKVDEVASYFQSLKNNPSAYQKAKEQSLLHIQNFNFNQIAEAIELVMAL